MMRRFAPRCEVFAVIMLAALFGAHYAGTVAAHGLHHEAYSSDRAHKLQNANAHRKRDRIKVPLGRRLVDAIDNDGQPNPSTTTRQFEIEVDDDTANGSHLIVEEVQRMAVTSQTTYSFHETREFNPDKINDIAILASNPKEVEGLTMMSIDKSTGDVRGIQRGNTGHTRQIYLDDPDNSHHSNSQRKLHLKKMERRLGEELPDKKWSCGAEHAHDDDPKRTRNHVHDHSHDHMHDRSHSEPNIFENGEIKRDFSKARSSSSSTESAGAGKIGSGWIEPSKYSFHIDLSIDIDKYFIEEQGSAEAAVEYINFLIGAANVIYEHEIDTHLNIVHIQETELYDSLSTTKEALRAQRMHSGPNTVEGSPKIILHHALLGRYLGGGIAFIDSICDENWGYGVTSDISGKLSSLDELVLFDFFIVTHEIGHSLGSGHTFDAYDPPVDVCGACTIKPAEELESGAEDRANNVAIDGLPRENSATIMSYCNFCDGGLSNIAITLGGVWDGAEPRTDVRHWQNHPDIVGSVSNEPWRVSHNIWQTLSSKGECVNPPTDLLPSQGCNGDDDCDDGNSCTFDVCNESSMCAISEILDNCCGNGKCEPGEGQSQSCPPDCGPFSIKAPNPCDDCHRLDGFMVDIGVSAKAEKIVFIRSIILAYASPKIEEATINTYVTTEGSYVGKEKSKYEWEKIITVNVEKYNAKRGIHFVEIELYHSIPVGIGKRRGFYFEASEDIILFGEGVYNIRNDQDVELYSSRAVSGSFGNGIDGFSLNLEVSYVLDDSAPPASPLEPTTPELAQMPSDDVGITALPPLSHPSPPPPSSTTSTPSSDDIREDKTPRTPVEEVILPPSSSSENKDTDIQNSLPSSIQNESVGGHVYTSYNDHITWYPPLDGKAWEEPELDDPVLEEAVSSHSFTHQPVCISSFLTLTVTILCLNHIS